MGRHPKARLWTSEKRKVTGSTPVPTTTDDQVNGLVIGLIRVVGEGR